MLVLLLFLTFQIVCKVQVQLFYDNNLRFNTSSDGIKVTGPTSGPGVGIGTTAGHDPLILASFNNAVTNNSQFRIVSKRDTDGTDWTTAYTRIQQRIDVTDQAYIHCLWNESSGHSCYTNATLLFPETWI